MSFASVQIQVSDKLFLRDPQQSKLGRNLIEQGIFLLDEIGLEAFTFRKLAQKMGSTEASIYRYFENKHYFLVYILSWYWEWVRYRIDFNSMNVNDPSERLKIIIKTIVDTVRLSTPASYIDRDALNRVVIAEGTKAYHIKSIDTENKEGFFSNYKSLAQKIADTIKQANPSFPYPKSLATNLLEMTNNQIYFAQHMPALTDAKIKRKKMDQIEEMLTFFVFKLLDL